MKKQVQQFGYLAMIMIIFSVIVASVFTYQFYQSLNHGLSYFEEKIHEISYQNQELSINSGKEMILENKEELVPIVIINTQASTEQENEYKERIAKYENGIILLKDRIVYKNEMLSQNIEYSYQNIAEAYQISNFTKEDVVNFIRNINQVKLYGGFLLIMFVYMYIIYFTSTFVDVIMLAILGLLFAKIVGIKIKFKACMNMGVYALTLPIILNLVYIIVNTFTGFYIQYFNWMYTTISYIYMIVAILMIKTDLMNQQIELMKIVEEQEKVRKQIEEKKKDKEEEPKEKKDNEPPEEKKKEKDDGVGNNGLAPQG